MTRGWGEGHAYLVCIIGRRAGVIPSVQVTAEEHPVVVSWSRDALGGTFQGGYRRDGERRR
jgi:hypothetical protein